eukprot:CAMPEP_0113872294 /NCGR_PEP_ID=MMETSP0780_2-20120614/3125_1 /TAXON_ID=652834 /ORGANISM="Palpitomonas bilix" /LENGTH=199 /DNA_ID=CAMNT_0000857793 /DNA_START=338 /DNA_END=937 /DNA_ORIENTATION=- /assembly_acc=CAM_ASM_000599
MDSIIRVVVVGRNSGEALFESLRGWMADARTEAVCNLIQVFHQFAREIDDGRIGAIEFKSRIASRTKSFRRSSAARDLFLPPKVSLVTAETARILVGVFVSETQAQPSARKLAKWVAEHFTKRYGDALIIEEHKHAEWKDKSVLVRFKEFQGVLENHISKIIRASNQNSGVIVGDVEVEVHDVKLEEVPPSLLRMGGYM